LKGDELTLVIPLNNGVLAPLKLHPATVDDYNKALAGLAKGAEVQNAQAQREREEREAIASQQQAVKNGIERVQAAISTLADAVAALKDVDYGDVLKGYSDHLDDMRSHYQEVKDEAAVRPLTNYQLSKVRYALSHVDYDMSHINYDGDKMKYVAGRQQEKISSVKEAMGALREAWNTLQAAQAANSTGSPSVPFAEGDINQRISQAETEISAAEGALRGALGKAASFEKQAKQIRTEATSFVNRIKASDN
jgi:chromosome segregation ATPase